ncbi:hypothetical protein ACFLQ6_05515 [Thermoproteota archaeon]
MARTKPRTFRMTIASVWYDKVSKIAREYEMHFKVARRGDIRNIRRYLAKRGVEYFQGHVYGRFTRWPKKRKVRIAFEREQPAVKTQRQIRIEMRQMEIKGRRWKATPLPSRVIGYVRKRIRRRTNK